MSTAAAAIDLEKLQAAAYGGTTPMAIIDREWLQGVYRALSGTPFVDVSPAQAPGPVEREVRIMHAIGKIVLPGAG